MKCGIILHFFLLLIFVRIKHMKRRFYIVLTILIAAIGIVVLISFAFASKEKNRWSRLEMLDQAEAQEAEQSDAFLDFE